MITTLTAEMCCSRDDTPMRVVLSGREVTVYECRHGHSVRVERIPVGRPPMRAACQACGQQLDSPSAKGMAALYCVTCRAEKRAEWGRMRQRKPHATPAPEARAWKEGLYA